MCFHSQQTKKAEEIAKRFGLDKKNIPLEVTGIFNGFEFPKTPVISSQNHQEVQLFNWGLIPSWSENKDIRKFTLNAKIETLSEKPSFKNVVQQRCLILSDGFFEWQWLDSKGRNKQKYKITSAQNELFTFAGLWSKWEDLDSNTEVHSYTIITTQANSLMSEIHNSKKRMPLIVPKEKEYDWLDAIPISEAIKFNVPLQAENLSPQARLF